MRYAQGTTVSSDRTMTEIRRLIFREGGTEFSRLETPGRVGIGFVFNNRQVRWFVSLPPIENFARSPEKRLHRTPEVQMKAWEQEINRLHRSLLMTIKAKFVSVRDGIETFDQAFLPHIVLTNDQTVYEHIKTAQIERTMPLLLTGGEKK